MIAVGCRDYCWLLIDRNNEVFRVIITIFCMKVLRNCSVLKHAKTEKGIPFYCIIVIMLLKIAENDRNEAIKMADWYGITKGVEKRAPDQPSQRSVVYNLVWFMLLRPAALEESRKIRRKLAPELEKWVMNNRPGCHPRIGIRSEWGEPWGLFEVKRD